MRLSTPLSLCLAAAAALLPTTATAATGVTMGSEAVHTVPGAGSGAAPAPDCADGSRTFPLTARIHGGPTTYRAGGDPGTWYLDLTNTTDRPCTAVHPVVVLTDTGRSLRPGQVHMVFHDGPRAHPVRFEATDENELVGAFDDGFPGFTVDPGHTVTVEVTLAVAAGAVPDEVTVKAAVVRRRGDDGEWVGQSGDYRFGIDTEPATASEPPASPAPVSTAAAAAASSSPSAIAEAAQQLARTGLGSAQRAALALASVLLAMGGALLLFRRRR